MDNVDNVDKIWKASEIQGKSQKKIPQKNKNYPRPRKGNAAPETVDNVDNYIPRRFSPIFTTSPAPIVINKSSFMQFSKRKFSISSKEGK